MGSLFMSVYGMAIDSILQCSIIDEEINKVLFKIYIIWYQIKNLKKIIENRPPTLILPSAAKRFLSIIKMIDPIIIL